MRGTCLLIAFAALATAGCDASSESVDLGEPVDLADADLLEADLAVSDGGSTGDAAMKAYSCSAPPMDSAACISDDGCALIASGCYCGAQPVNGIALAYRDGAAACEATAASMCLLACAMFDSQVAQDGKMTVDPSAIKVQCADKTPSGVGTCKSYVP